MIDVEPLIRRDLDLLVELPEGLHPDWQDVTRRVRQPQSGLPAELAARRSLLQRIRQRPVLVLVLVLVVALVPVSALAVAGQNPWWFLRFPGVLGNGPAKGSVVVVLKQGSWGGQGWVLTAYKSTRGLCYQLTETSGAGKTTNLGSGGCGAAPGEMVRRANGQPQRLTVSFMGGTIAIRGSLKRQIRYVVGPVVPSATEVVVTLANGTVIRTPTFTVPSKLGIATRFYAAQTPIVAPLGATTTICRARAHGLAETRPARIVGLDAGGHVVARLVVPAVPPGVMSGLCQPHRNHYGLPTNIPAAGRLLKTIERVTGPYGATATVAVGAVVPITSYRGFPTSDRTRVIQPTRCWRARFSDGESLAGCAPIAKSLNPELGFEVQHAGRDTFFVVTSPPRTGFAVTRIELRLANGHVLTAKPTDGIVVFAIPRNALSTTRSQRGFLTAYGPNGQRAVFDNNFAHVETNREAVYYRSCPPGSSCY